MSAPPSRSTPAPATAPGGGARQLLLIVWPLLAALVLLIGLAVASLQLLGAANAYVGGESQWSKRQKDAVLQLERYAQTRNEADYAAFLADMQLPLADHAAREELDQPDYDPARVRRELIAGGADADDVPGLIRLYRWYPYIPGMSRAVTVWAEGDHQIDGLMAEAGALHQAVRAGHDSAALRARLQGVWDINARLGVAENRFSLTVQSAARWLHHILVWLLLAAGGIFILFAFRLSRRMLDNIRRYEGERLLRQHRQQETERLAHVGSWTWVPARRQAEYSPETRRLFGLDPDSPRPFPEQYLAAIHPADRPQQARLWDEAVETGRSHQTEFRTLLGGEEPRWISEVVHSQVDAHGRIAAISGTIMDVTAHKQAEAHIRQLAHFDGVTGLPNRSQFYQHLAGLLPEAARQQQRLAVLCIELDGIRVLHDSLGHDIADLALKIAAKRLRECGGDAGFLARLGSEDFALLYSGCKDPSDVVAVARMIHHAISLPVTVHNHVCRLSSVIGISIFPDDTSDPQILCRNASLAMERAGQEGRNRHEFYSADMGQRSQRRLALEAGLHAALRRGELRLHYQPRVDLADDSVRGVEALLRWEHPEEGLLGPIEFISLAEETGLIVPLGAWALRTACQQARQWQEQGGRPLRMAVNLSARQLDDELLVDTVRGALEENGLDPSMLELEVTESMVMARPEHCISVLHQLKALGLQLAVDDFGTGHSSLAYLKRLPVDCLKIDRAFVSDLPDDLEATAIARAVIALAHSLRLKVVAEGVETAAQVGFLREQGCDEVQGYYFSRPVPAAEAEAFVGATAAPPEIFEAEPRA